MRPAGNEKIEGHTDNVPVIENPRFKSIGICQVPELDRLPITSSKKVEFHQAELMCLIMNTKPVGPNDTATNRAKNRRIEVIVSG